MMNEATYTIYEKSEEFKLWPIDKEQFLKILYGKDDAENRVEVIDESEGDQLKGVIGVKYKEVGGKKKGRIVWIFVEKQFRKQGVGQRLLQKGIEWLKEQGASKVKFGGGAGSYFWPGLPENLGLNQFFLKNGFSVKDEGCVDMWGEISDFKAPSSVYDLLEREGVKILFASKEWKERILDFVREHFIDWYQYYHHAFTKGGFGNVFFAHSGSQVVAVSMLWEHDFVWKRLFDAPVGGGGALGVSPDWQGKGIGLAMKSWGTELLRDRGIRYVWIGWTYAIDFYRKLGFQIWRKYLEVEKEI